MEKTDILSLDLSELEAVLVENGEKKFRADQIFDWLHQKCVDDFDSMTNLSALLRSKLSDSFFISSEGQAVLCEKTVF